MRRILILCVWAAALVAAGCSSPDPMSSPAMSDASGKLTVSGGRAAGLTELRPVNFVVRVENISQAPMYTASGAFTTPVGEAGPGALLPGATYRFSFYAGPGDRLSFATMYVQSNDLFYGPDPAGIPLWAGATPISGDVTSMIYLWDAGTEVNQAPGVGADQAPRQSGADTGASEGGTVRMVADGYQYGNTAEMIRVSVTPQQTDAGALFTVDITNLAASTTPLAPGVFAVHADGMPLFVSGQMDGGHGLEALAEDGNPSALAAMLAMHAGPATILAPGVWALHRSPDPVFAAGEMDRGAGLEALAEDGNPAALAQALMQRDGVKAAGAFTTPVGADGPGALPPGATYEFHIRAEFGDRLSLATMFVQSNDLFFAPMGDGIDPFRYPGDVTEHIYLWDAGTEINQAPGLGLDQAPRQSGPNTGATEAGMVRIVDDGFAYPHPAQVIRVTVSVH